MGPKDGPRANVKRLQSTFQFPRIKDEQMPKVAKDYRLPVKNDERKRQKYI